jgi:glucose/arabinose dehydrogenase
MDRHHQLLHLPLCLLLLGLAGTPGGAVELPDGFTDEPLADGLATPVGFAFLPDGRAFLIEQKQISPADEGWVHLWADGELGDGPILEIPEVNTAGNERGLLGVAVDPGWPSRPYVYVQYTHLAGVSHIRRYTASGALTDPDSHALILGDAYDVLTTLPDALEWHNGGTLRFGPDGMLYASHGDDASDHCQDFQDPSRWYGVVLRLDVSSLPDGPGGPPPLALLDPGDNPWTGPDDAAGLTYAIGLRNPFRFTIDPDTGTLYVGDVGEFDYEEMNEVHGGESYGWPTREGAHPFEPGAACGLPAGTDPIAEIAHDGVNPFSVIAGPRYRAPAGAVRPFPDDYLGDLFFHEFYAGWIRRLTHEGSGVWSVAPPADGQPTATEWATGLSYLADLQIGPDGALYYVKRIGSPSFGRIVGPEAIFVPGSTPSPASALRVHPNPGRVGHAMRISVADGAGAGTFTVFDAAGRKVMTLARKAGQTNAAWDARDARGRPLAPGRYFVEERRSDGVVATTPITLTP